MGALTLQKTAERMGISRNKLIQRMRQKGLLNEQNLPATPKNHAYLIEHEGQWFHPAFGQQFSRSTRVRQEGLRWLAAQLDLLPPPPPERDRADVH